MGTNAPGIQAKINTRPIGQPAPAQGSDFFFVIGWSLFGPVETPTLVTGWTDYVSKFGGFHSNSEMANAVYLFFKNGGRRAWIVRASTSGTAPFLNINDRAGTPVATLKIAAKYPSLLADCTYAIAAGDVANTVNLTVESLTLGIREVFKNFKITLTSAETEAIAAGNSPLYSIACVNAESRLVVLTSLNSATVAPNNLPALSTVTNGVVQTTALTGGADDISQITSLDNALETLSELYGTGTIAAPGFPSFAAAIIAHAENFKRIAIVEIPDTNDTNPELITYRATIDSSFAAAYYPPRIQMRDFKGSGQVKSYLPTGAIAGIFAKAEEQIGIHKAPANYRLADVVGWDIAAFGAMNEGQREFLNERQINAIALIPEQGIKLYGARVLKSYGRITALHEQRILNAIYYRLKRSLQEFVFEPANQQLFRELRSVCSQYLRELYQSGALYSANGTEDAAFRVVCDESNNPPEQLQQNRVSVEVWVHLVGMAEQIVLSINSAPLATNFNTLITGGDE